MTARDIPGLDAQLYTEASRLAGHHRADVLSEALSLGLWLAVGVVVGLLIVFYLRGRK
mgnify:CR=1 FL=1